MPRESACRRDVQFCTRLFLHESDSLFEIPPCPCHWHQGYSSRKPFRTAIQTESAMPAVKNRKSNVNTHVCIEDLSESGFLKASHALTLLKDKKCSHKVTEPTRSIFFKHAE
jgi:hypothetical protein